MAIPMAVTEAYMNPAWDAYNRGLTRLSARGNAKGEPVIAEGCGHFIQRDSPGFVADEIVRLLDRVCGE
jgi:pimeloyl-ACP methyl ester carboxylesterase